MKLKKLCINKKPLAKLVMIRKEVVYYKTQLSDLTIVNFEIPVNDMGDADLFPEMDAKSLNRWIIIYK